MIWDGVGDWYDVDYSLKGETRMRGFRFHTLKHHNQEVQIKDAIGKALKVNPDDVEIYHAIRVVQA